MKKREIVVLDCGVEIRMDEPGVLFSSMDSGREFAFGIKSHEIDDMIAYLISYKSQYPDVKASAIGPKLSEDVPHRQMTPEEKAARTGVLAGSLSPAGSVKGRVIPAVSVSVHKG